MTTRLVNSASHLARRGKRLVAATTPASVPAPRVPNSLHYGVNQGAQSAGGRESLPGPEAPQALHAAVPVAVARDRDHDVHPAAPDAHEAAERAPAGVDGGPEAPA